MEPTINALKTAIELLTYRATEAELDYAYGRSDAAALDKAKDLRDVAGFLHELAESGLIPNVYDLITGDGDDEERATDELPDELLGR